MKADQIDDLLDLLLEQENSRFFLYGTTATPLHGKDPFGVQERFLRQCFWGYKDTAEAFLLRGDSPLRDYGDILDQLSAAIASGGDALVNGRLA